MKKSVVVVAMFAVTSICKADEKELEYFRNKDPFETIIATPTNLTIMFRMDRGLAISYPDDPSSFRSEITLDYAKSNKALILTPDKRVIVRGLSERYFFTPVFFKNQQKGFRIAFMSRAHGSVTTNYLEYVALSDKPTKVSAEDVEMILERGEWKTFEREGGTQASPSSREKPVTTTQDETPDNIAKDEPSEGRATASPPSRLWLYALIPLCLLVILYLMRRKPAS